MKRLGKKGWLLIGAAGVLIAVVCVLCWRAYDLHRYDGAIDRHGLTIRERFLVPDGYVRVSPEEGSFAEYLQNLPLKPYGKSPRYWNGRINRNAAKAGVFDQTIPAADLQQCADSCIRLWAEYLYEKQEWDHIGFHFASGFYCDYASWIAGKRVQLVDGQAVWTTGGQSGDTSYETFLRYLDKIYEYANTASLQQETAAVSAEQLSIGDMFVITAAQQNTRYGHAVIVVDLCVNPDSGERLYLIAEGTTPASENYILQNATGEYGGFWISLDGSGNLETAGWRCDAQYIRRFIRTK